MLITRFVPLLFSYQILFLYFGYKLLKDAYDMDGVGPSEELQEVEEELRKSKGKPCCSGDTIGRKAVVLNDKMHR